MHCTPPARHKTNNSRYKPLAPARPTNPFREREGVGGFGEGLVWHRGSEAGAGWQVRSLSGHSSPDPVYSVVISADGKRVVSGSWDQTIKIWDVETGAAVRGGCV